MSHYMHMIAIAAVLVCQELYMCRVHGQAAPAALARSDIEGQDINCGQLGPGPDRKPVPLSTCRVCGDWNSLISSCQSNSQCVAFTYDGSCGYLKSAQGPTKYREGSAVFVLTDKQGAGAAPLAANAAGPPVALTPGVQQLTAPTAPGTAPSGVTPGNSAQPAGTGLPASQEESWTTGNTQFSLFSQALTWEKG